MADSHPQSTANSVVPDTVIPRGTLPPLRYRDLPEPISWKKMIGPSIMLAGLALGSGEFVMWPYITYKSGFIFFWACILGVITQFFLNMEIERYTLATGESAITGFCRLSRHWAWVMLVLNILPWAWPGWATGAGQLLSWLIFGANEVVGENGVVTYEARYVSYFGIAGLWLVGVALTAGPVVYNTVERIQVILVTLIMALATLLGLVLVRLDAVLAMTTGIVSIGQMPELGDATGLSFIVLLAALAFAGAGGTTNLSQSNFIKDKGYGMGRFIGRITSPVTGQDEAIADLGYHFPDTPENQRRWDGWWRNANIEHFLSFFVTCVICLCLMSLLTYSIFYDEGGNLNPGMEKYGEKLNFVWGQATVMAQQPSLGSVLRLGFMIMGVAVLLTTELGVLDATARVSTDIVKVNFLRTNDRWSLSRLYFIFLWGEILLGTAILLIPDLDEPLFLLVTSAAMNGGVMFVYSILLLYLNSKILPRRIAIGPWRFLMIIWSAAFFGYFSIQALRLTVLPYLAALFGSG